METEIDNDSIMIARAEGAYAAKTMLDFDANPYDPFYAGLHSAWKKGFTDELLKLRMDLKLMREHLGKKIEENAKLLRDNESLKREIRYMEFRYIEEYDEKDAYEAVEAEMAQ